MSYEENKCIQRGEILMTTKGIDVSKHQGTIDFGKVKASGYDFVIIRAGYGRSITQMDERFEQNYRAADRKSTRLNSSHNVASRMPSSA